MSPSRHNLTPYKCLSEHLAFVQCTRSEGDFRSEEEEYRVDTHATPFIRKGRSIKF